jgi:hypothetical protein
VSAVTQAFQTLFDSSSTVAERVAVIENGSSLQTALADATNSSLAANSTGVRIDDVTFPDDSGCTSAGVDSPCAKVLYDILGAGGTTLLPNALGYAVSVNGTWLVSTATACSLLELFWQTAGMAGSPPGCPAALPPTTPTTVNGGDPATTTTQGQGGGNTESSANTTTTTAAAASGTPTTKPASSTTVGAATGAGSSHTSSGDPTTAPDPVVEASSNSLAFTGVGVIAEWLAVAGGILILLGFALLVMADTPRRLMYRLAHRGTTGPRLG